MRKAKKLGQLNFRDYFSTITMSFTESITAAMMGGFMVYMTDYAGIGKWGAILGSALLMFARIFDAVNDPLEAWIMDRAKVGKHGKYKPFILLSILMSAIGVCCLFFIPERFSGNPVLICAWVIFFYLMYDIGTSFFAPNLVYRTLTLDQTERGKLIVGPRLLGMVISMVNGGLIGIVYAVNENIGNVHTAYGLTVLMLVAGLSIISLFGASLVKERYHATAEKEEEIKITDLFKVLKHNKALSTMNLSVLFSGFVWTFLFAAMNYYIKWAYCADLSTGAINAETLATLSMVAGLMMIVPLIIGTAIATPLMKLVKSAMKLYRALLLIEAIAGGTMFILHIVGVLPNSPALYFSLLAVIGTCIGIHYIPQETINLECMDYELYVGGKDRAALCNAVGKFINKAQNAMSSGLVGIVLIAIGYQVDSATDTYIGELSAIPSMLTWFVVIMGLIPCALGIIAYLILKKYPITDEIRAKMREMVKK